MNRESIVSKLEKFIEINNVPGAIKLLTMSKNILLTDAEYEWIFELIIMWKSGPRTIPVLLEFLPQSHLIKLHVRNWFLGAADSQYRAKIIKVYGAFNPAAASDRVGVSVPGFLTDPYISFNDRMWVLKNVPGAAIRLVVRLMNNIHPLTADEFTALVGRNLPAADILLSMAEIDNWSTSRLEELVNAMVARKETVLSIDIIGMVSLDGMSEYTPTISTKLIANAVKTNSIDLKKTIKFMYTYYPATITPKAFLTAHLAGFRDYEYIPFEVITSFTQAQIEMYRLPDPEMYPLTDIEFRRIVSPTTLEVTRFINTNPTEIVAENLTLPLTEPQWDKFWTRVQKNPDNFTDWDMRRRILAFCPYTSGEQVLQFIKPPYTDLEKQLIQIKFQPDIEYMTT